MITCRDMAELLFDLISSEVPPERHGQIEQHLRTCPSCVAYLETYRLTIALTRQLPRSELPTQQEARLWATWTQYIENLNPTGG